MPDLNFNVVDAQADADAAAPLLAFALRVTNSRPREPVQSIALRAQIRIDSTRRRYSPEEQARLVDLFGEPDRWSRTLGSLLWTHAQTTVPTFDDEIVVSLPVPSTFDFNVAATKYFHGLAEGEIPLTLHFSGAVFYHEPDGRLQVSQIPWDKEASYRLPVAAWREMIDRHYPASAWLRLGRDAFDRLLDFKCRSGIPTWEAAVERLLDAAARQSTALESFTDH